MTSKIVISHTAPLESTVSDLVDWVEFKVLESEFNSYSLRELAGLNEQYEDEENENFTEQDLENDESVIRVSDEIANRMKVLKDSYPFELTKDDNEIRLKDSDKNIGEWVYLYCLIISHRKADGVNSSDFALTNEDRDILQIASVYAAAGDFGDVVSFGYPRPDNTNFLSAMESTFKLVGEGTPRGSFLPGVSPHANDAEIDLVAWQNMNDGLPGKKLLIGQVASGANWKGKTVISAVDYVFSTYFSLKPCSSPIPAMFIPFCIDEEHNGTRQDVLHDLTNRFGIVYYRLRLPLYALRGYLLHDNVPRKDESDKIQAFIKSILGDQVFNNTFAA